MGTNHGNDELSFSNFENPKPPNLLKSKDLLAVVLSRIDGVFYVPRRSFELVLQELLDNYWSLSQSSSIEEIARYTKKTLPELLIVLPWDIRNKIMAELHLFGDSDLDFNNLVLFGLNPSNIITRFLQFPKHIDLSDTSKSGSVDKETPIVTVTSYRLALYFLGKFRRRPASITHILSEAERYELLTEMSMAYNTLQIFINSPYIRKELTRPAIVKKDVIISNDKTPAEKALLSYMASLTQSHQIYRDNQVEHHIGFRKWLEDYCKVFDFVRERVVIPSV